MNISDSFKSPADPGFNMNKSNLNFKVVVSDEIFDFRTLEASRSRPSTIPIRTLSHNAIDVKHKREILTSSERHIASLDRVAKSVYNTTPLLPLKSRKSKPKTRSKTVDPRFRRSRSPILKLINASHSTNVLSKSDPSQAKTIRPFSASSPSIQTTSACKEPCKETVQPKQEDQEMSVSIIKPCIMTGIERNFMEGDENHCKDIPSIENNFLNSLNYVGNINLFGSDSVDEVEEKTHLTPQIPYWNDPRVALHKKCQQKVTPVRNRSVLPVKKLSSGIVMCRKYEPDVDDNGFSAYKYDDGTEICSCSVMTERIDIRNRVLAGNSYKIPRKLLGSLVGLIVVSLIVWSINWKFSLSSLWQSHTHYTNLEDDNLLVHCVKYIFLGVVRGIDTLYNKLCQLLVLQRKDLFSQSDPNEKTSWWWWWRNIV